MSVPFRDREVEVVEVGPLYRARCRRLPDWYISTRMGTFCRMARLEDAMLHTLQWWQANLVSGWSQMLKLEKVSSEISHR